jgi:hypothetical protein
VRPNTHLRNAVSGEAMKYLTTALAISFGMGMVLFGIVYPMFHDAHLAAGIAAIPIAGCHHIAEMLERREARQSVTAHQVAEIHRLEGYVVAWPRLVAQTTITFVGILLAAAVLGTTLASLLLGFEADLTRAQESALALAMAPIVLAGAYYVGRWIGSRCANPSAVMVLLVLATACLIVTGLVAPFGGATVPLRSLVIETVISFGVLAVAGLIGYRQGRKRRVAEYMDYLLSILPPETGKVLVDLAYDEARKAASVTPPGERNHHRDLAPA